MRTRALSLFSYHCKDKCNSKHWIEPNLDCNHNFLIDLTPNGISFDTKSIGRKRLITFQIWFDSIRLEIEFPACPEKEFKARNHTIYAHCSAEIKNYKRLS